MNYSGNVSENELENCRKQLSQLQSENDELIRNLHNVNEKLRDSERLKGHFISNITNEIINPFASVLALAVNIQQLKEGEIALAHRMAELIFEEAFHLDFQLKNIFAAALIEAGKDELKITRFSLKDLSDQLIHYFSVQLQKKKIRLSVSFTSAADSDEAIMFSSDREKLDLIFERFGQVDNTLSRKAEGTGIGLAIVKTFVEKLDGKITVESKENVGSTFTVTFPLIKVKLSDVKPVTDESCDQRLIKTRLRRAHSF